MSPQCATLAVLDQVRRVLVEYAAYLPLTIGQIFTDWGRRPRLPPKTEVAYDRLGEALNRAHRARLLAFDAIRDDSAQIVIGDYGAHLFTSLADDVVLTRDLGLPGRPANVGLVTVKASVT